MTQHHNERIVHDAYGKARVRVMKVTRDRTGHRVRQLTVEIRLEGDFVSAFVDGDNQNVVATDSMKNTVYSLAKDDAIASIEDFGLLLARHFVNVYPQVASTTVEIAETQWSRMPLAGRGEAMHPHAFTRVDGEQPTSTVCVDRDGSVRVASGIRGLVVLKSTDSAFEGFVRDGYTTLAEASDRIFATEIACQWAVAAEGVDFGATRAAARQALLEAFAEHKSLSVQHTLLHMARRVFAACPAIEQITLKLPNLHYIPVDLTPFGQQNELEIFVPIDEPHGLIQATVARGR